MGEIREFESGNIIDVDPSEIREVLEDDEKNTVNCTIPEEYDKDYGDDVTNVESTEIESNEEETTDIFIKTITPYKITFSKKDNRDIAIIMYLCKDDNDKLFIIDRNIVVRNEEHLLDLECIPFAESKEYDFVNDKICTQLMLGNLDNYICDMKFSIDKEDIKLSSPVLRTTLTNVKTKKTKLL